MTVPPSEVEYWWFGDRIDGISLTAAGDDRCAFSYEFRVEFSPSVMVAATTSDELKRRGERGGHFRVWGGRRTTSKRDATSKPMPPELLGIFVVDNQHWGSGTSDPHRGAGTVHVEAYLSTSIRTDCSLAANIGLADAVIRRSGDDGHG